jgi:hypothetical protein
MITWTLFGHLMTPEHHKTTADIEHSESANFEVTTSISKQRKQGSENQRVRGSSPWRRTAQRGVHLSAYLLRVSVRVSVRLSDGAPWRFSRHRWWSHIRAPTSDERPQVTASRLAPRAE